MHNYIIKNDRLSTGKNAAIIRVVAPIQSCRSTSMAPALKEDHVIGSNECKSVISTGCCLSVSRSFYNMVVSAVTRSLVLKYTLYDCVFIEKFWLNR